MTAHTGTPRPRSAASAGGDAPPLQTRPRDYHARMVQDFESGTLARIHGKPERRAQKGAGILLAIPLGLIAWIVIIYAWRAL